MNFTFYFNSVSTETLKTAWKTRHNTHIVITDYQHNELENIFRIIEKMRVVSIKGPNAYNQQYKRVASANKLLNNKSL